MSHISPTGTDRLRHLGPALLSRRRFVGLAGLATAGVAAGCSAPSEASLESTAFRAPAYKAAPVPDGVLTSPLEGVSPIATKPVQEYFDAVPTAPGRGAEVSTFQIIWNSAGSPLERNDRWQAVNERLNVTLNPTLVPYTDFDQKTATMLASGELPDLSYVIDQNPTVAQAITDGAFADLSDQLAGDEINNYPNLATIRTSTWEACSKNGRIFGIPAETDLVGNFPVARLDLLKMVGLDDVPDSADGYREMLTELAKLKRVNGRQVWAKGSLTDGSIGLFKAMFRLGPTFQEDADGKITSAIMNERYEAFLEYMADLWQRGVFHPDAFSAAPQNLFADGQEATSWAAFTGYYWPGRGGRVGKLLKRLPDAEVTHYVMPSFDDQPAVFERPTGYWGMVAISASAAEDPERLRELLGIVNWFRSPYGSTEDLLITHGVEGLDFDFDKAGNIVYSDRPGHSDDGSATNLGVGHAPINVMPNETAHLAENVMACHQGMVEQSVVSPVAGLVSSVAARNDAKLTSILQDYENGIISGSKPLSALQEFRDAWLQQGGREVLDDYDRLRQEQR